MDNESRLVPIPEDDAELAKLLELSEEKYKVALTSLITGKTPKDAMYQRPIRGGTEVDYVPGWWFIEQLNALFGHLWDFEVLRETIGEKQIWLLGKLTVKLPGGMAVHKTAYGGSDIKVYADHSPKAGKVIDIGDDLKAAATDSLKKAATLFGLASDIYRKREILERTGPGKDQLDALYKVGSSKGMDKEKVDTYCKQKFDKLPNEIETVLVLGLIAELRSK